MAAETFTWKGRFGPIELKLGNTTFRPSTISLMLADALRVEPDSTVIDVGCGSGILSIIAAKLGAGRVHGVDAAPETVEIASANAAACGVGDLVEFSQGDLFETIDPNLTADVVIGDVSGIPDDIARSSGWFPSGLSGGPTGAELPMRMIDQARKRLNGDGRLFLPTGSLQDENSILDKARALYGSIKKLSERAIPLPTSLAEDPALLRMLKEKVISLTQRGSRLLWTATIWEVRV